MTVDLVQVGDAIVAGINALVTQPAFVSTRGIISVDELQQMGSDLRVRVVPVAMSEAGGTRGARWEDVDFVIQIAKRVEPEIVAEVDELIALELEIRDGIQDVNIFADLTVESVIVGGSSGALFDVDMLISHRMFIGRVDVTLANRS